MVKQCGDVFHSAAQNPGCIGSVLRSEQSQRRSGTVSIYQPHRSTHHCTSVAPILDPPYSTWGPDDDESSDQVENCRRERACPTRGVKNVTLFAYVDEFD